MYAVRNLDISDTGCTIKTHLKCEKFWHTVSLHMQYFQLQTKNFNETRKRWLLILAGCKYICGPAKFHLQLCQTLAMFQPNLTPWPVLTRVKTSQRESVWAGEQNEFYDLMSLSYILLCNSLALSGIQSIFSMDAPWHNRHQQLPCCYGNLIAMATRVKPQ